MTANQVSEWATRSGNLEGHHFFRTSGSSGHEKWVALSQDALEWSAGSVVKALQITSADVLGLALPVNHVGGFGVKMRAQISGSKLAKYEKRWSSCDFAGWCRDFRVTVTSLVPTQVHDLVEDGLTGSEHLRVIVVGGGFLSDELRSKARALKWPVVPSYGMTETSSQVATGDGLPLLPGWEARIEQGRLALKGGGLLTGVIERVGDQLTLTDPKEAGWFLTSDLAEIREDHLRILGRADRRVKVLGELVDLDALEECWRKKLDQDVALISKAHPRRGVTLHLFLEGSDQGVSKFNADLPGPERLQDWQVVDGLPRSALGKIDRAELIKSEKQG